MSRFITPIIRCRAGFLSCLFCCGLAAFPSVAPSSARADDAAAPAAKPKKLPDPEAIELTTRDGLKLEATYYGSNLGKNAVPIIMLHGWKGSGTDFDKLARDMQLLGHAVIVPDLRGHGKSTKIVVGDDERTIDQTMMNRGDFEAMVEQDVEAVKKYLMTKNNAGELNIEKLCVVGSDMGAVVAVNWAIKDSAHPRLLTGKQGQDVKALVLISPPMNFRGIPLVRTLGSPIIQHELSILIIAGAEKGGKPYADAQAIFKRLSRARPNEPTTPEEIRKNKDLFFVPLKTSLQGTQILLDKTLQATVSADVGQFIDLRLVQKKFPWTMRKSPLGN